MSTDPILITFVLEEDEAGERLDKTLAPMLPGLSRTQLQRLIKEGLVTVDGETTKPAYSIGGDEVVRVTIPPRPELQIEAEPIALNVVYEDADIAVIDKPAGMVIHPATGHTSGTLVNAILARWPQIAGVGPDVRPGIVHRLDKDTSGLVVVALTEEARLDLIEQFADRDVKKVYLALAEGLVEEDHFRVSAPIGRDPNNRKRMAVIPTGRSAASEFIVQERLASASGSEHTLMEVRPRTGRTHQIRVHAQYIGHPLVGDEVYGYRKQRIKLDRHFLHAAELTIFSPSTGAPIRTESPLPPELQAVLDSLFPA
jgi:23S rRNA pseudouridine1911/1915/1917 synthase